MKLVLIYMNNSSLWDVNNLGKIAGYNIRFYEMN